MQLQLSIYKRGSVAPVRLFIVITFVLALAPAVCLAQVEASPPTEDAGGDEGGSARAVALLHGVAAKRNAFDSIRAEFTWESRRSLDSSVVYHHFLVEQHAEQRRFEHLDDSAEPSVYILSEPDVVYGFQRVPHADLEIFDLQDAVRSRGTLVFDPRTVGLTNIHTASASVEGLLWLDRYDSIQLISSDEVVDGVQTSRIKLTMDNMVSELWISEPGFRVHRRTAVLSEMEETTINSTYDANNSDSPFPTQVAIQTSVDGSKVEHLLHVVAIDLDAKISPERFKIDSMNLPVNTMVNDYRVNRIVGYWDGQKIVDEPTPGGVAPTDIASDGTSAFKPWLIGVNLVVVALLAVWLFLLKSKRG
jgi:hypothetical protein